MSEYRVKLDIFAGPLDLLLYLVRKEEVDIYDIPIARVTAEYVKYIEMMQELDIELAGDFLVMAAALMEIKSIMLLPVTEEEEEAVLDVTDPRTELIKQLLEYKKFKDAANQLQDAAAERKERFTRPDTIISSLKKEKEPEVDLDEVSIWVLLEAFDNIMQSVGQYQSYEHIQDDTPIDLYQIALLHRLQSEGPMTLEALFADQQNRLVMVGIDEPLYFSATVLRVRAYITRHGRIILQRKLRLLGTAEPCRGGLLVTAEQSRGGLLGTAEGRSRLCIRSFCYVRSFSDSEGFRLLAAGRVFGAATCG